MKRWLPYITAALIILAAYLWWTWRESLPPGTLLIGPNGQMEYVNPAAPGSNLFSLPPPKQNPLSASQKARVAELKRRAERNHRPNWMDRVRPRQEQSR
jgi:hypothetical protein